MSRNGRFRAYGALMTVVALTVAGCVTDQAPQTAADFRKTVSSAAMGQVITFEVARPVRDIGRTFQAKAPECLGVAVKMSDRSPAMPYSVTASYKPTVVVGDTKAELRVQRKFSGAVYNPYAEPEGGSYFLTAEATAIGPTRSKIDIYGTKVGADELIRAVTGWANGQNLGCPDMTKT
jgi:hypothetical protein